MTGVPNDLEGSTPDQQPSGMPPRAALIAAVTLGVILATGVAVFGLTRPEPRPDPASEGPLPLVSVDAPHAGSPACAELMRALPGDLPSADGVLRRRELADPAPKAAAAWGAESPVVLRCGLGKPPELRRDSALQVVNDVQWLWLPAEGNATWYAVDRKVYIALTVPSTAAAGPVQALSDVIAELVPSAPVRP